MNKFIKVILVSMVILITACGQTGPLYLPGHPPPGYAAPRDLNSKNKHQIKHKHLQLHNSTAPNYNPLP